jgi:ribose transport system substrate-binding protein
MKRVALSALLILQLGTHALADQNTHFDPDVEASRLSWTKLSELGPAPRVVGNRFGAVIKNYTNDYWRLMAAGYRRQAAKDGVKLDVQAAQDELSPARQLSILETMIGGYYRAIMISPQSASNLQPAIEDAISANLALVDVDGAVVDNVQHFIGPVNRDIGVLVASWFIQHYPEGGKLAIIKGQAGVFSTVKRTAGFVETLEKTGKFSIVSSVYGDWDQNLSYKMTLDILGKEHDLIGIYCNNDVMALGAMNAVKTLHMEGSVHVFGTDGTTEAYSSIEAGELTGTVDMFPILIGKIGLRVAERLSVGQTVPRVVETPFALITKDDIARFHVDPDALEDILRDQEK